MKIEVPFNYSVYVGWRRSGSGTETYAGVVSVDVPEYGRDDVTGVFTTHSREDAYGRGNDPERAVLKGPDGFLVPFSEDAYRYHGETERDTRWLADSLSDPEIAFKKISGFLAWGKGDLSRSFVTDGGGIGAETFSIEAKPRRGKPAMERVKMRGFSDGEAHPLDDATAAVQKYLSESLRIVDGAVHVRTNEPFYAIENDRGTLRAVLRASNDVPTCPHVYRLDEIDAAVLAIEATGRTVARSGGTNVLRPDLLDRTFDATRVTNTFSHLVRHVTKSAHLLSAGDLETYLAYRAVPVRNYDDAEAADAVARHVDGLQAMMTLADRYGMSGNAPIDLRMTDADRHLSSYLDGRKTPDLVDEDMDAIFGAPGLR